MAQNPFLVVSKALAIVSFLHKIQTDKDRYSLGADAKVTEIIDSHPPENGEGAVVVESEMVVRFAYGMEDYGKVEMIPEIWKGTKPPAVFDEVILEEIRRGKHGVKVALRARPKQ